MTTSSRPRPHASEYADFYSGYVAIVPEGDIITLLTEAGAQLAGALRGITEDRSRFRYAEGKWSIREVVGHLIDAERIFAYRALRMARGDATPLPGFDENDYVRAAGSDARSLADLADELRLVRESTVRLFDTLPEEAWARRGTASGKQISVRALAYITVGHGQHHLRMLRERYGVQ